ncbi:MAG TPA: helix-turn-helix transcriptional regulator [Capsulimonadaceae bacterium]|jgi:transcriptional regulator with XRE-family HTH domain
MINIDLAARLRARREQMGVTCDEVAAVVDLEASGIEAIETGERGLTAAELRGVASYLCVEEAYLAGEQSLNELVASDQANIDGMIASIVQAFRALPNIMTQRVAYDQMKELLDDLAV